MGQDDCGVKCGRCGNVQTKMGAKDTLLGIGLIYALPFFSFLLGVSLGLIVLQDVGGRQIYSVLAGVSCMFFSYKILGKIYKPGFRDSKIRP